MDISCFKYFPLLIQVVLLYDYVTPPPLFSHFHIWFIFYFYFSKWFIFQIFTLISFFFMIHSFPWVILHFSEYIKFVSMIHFLRNLHTTIIHCHCDFLMRFYKIYFEWFFKNITPPPKIFYYVFFFYMIGCKWPTLIFHVSGIRFFSSWFSSHE